MDLSQVQSRKGPILVTAAIIESNDQILITKRVGDGESGLWEFPEGKVEYGENPTECLAREIEEELGIKIRVNSLLDSSSWSTRMDTTMLSSFTNAA